MVDNPCLLTLTDLNGDSKSDIAITGLSQQEVSLLVSCTINSVNETPYYSDEIIIFPNPTTANIEISVNTNENEIVNIYDVTGKLVLKQSIYKTTQINSQSLDPGVYTIVIGRLNKKLVVIR